MRIAIQMDAPARLNPAGDSTIALASEAQRRGHSIWWYEAASLSYCAGALHCQARRLRVTENAPRWYDEGKQEPLALELVDAVLMRQDPPFDMAYLSATYLLERLPSSVRVINSPAYVRNHPEKTAILDFPEVIPPTLISSDIEAIRVFQSDHERIVVKPLYGFGGHSVFVFSPGDSNLATLIEQFRQRSAEPLMVQAFLPEVKDKDVRVLLMNGKVSAALGRIPAEGSIRANMRVGGVPVAVVLNDIQTAICERVGSQLVQHGVLFAGLDLIGNYLTEINITSPTGIVAAQQLYADCNPAADFWDAVEALD